MAAVQPKCPNCGAPPAPGTPLAANLVCPYCSTPYAAPTGGSKTGANGAASSTAQKASPVIVAIAAVALVAGLVLLLRGGKASLPEGGGQREPTAASIQVLAHTNRANAEASPASVSLAAPPASALTKQPEQPASAKFVFHGKRSGYQSSFYVLGEVENTSPFTISKPEIVVVLVDSSGKELSTDSGYATKEYLEPGQKSYVNALIKDPPPHASMKFEVVARRVSYMPTLARGLRILDAQALPESWGGYKFTGKVENGGELAARFLNVEVFAFDGANKLLGVASGYAKTDRLEPGQTARYQLTTPRYDSPPARFETTVTGRLAD